MAPDHDLPPPDAGADSARLREIATRRARRAQARRRARRRRRRLGGLALVLIGGAAIVWIGSSSSAPRSSTAAGRPRAGARAPVARDSSYARGAPPPGLLPQTGAYPSASSAEFHSTMASLWAGVTQGSLAPALGAFFPEAAYVRVKEVPAASSDWTNRLVHEYALDIAAAHGLLGGGATRAQLVGVQVPDAYGHWVAPGSCYNAIGYHEVPNARVLFREDGEIRSFGIASMISWRGVWYVVHLGAVLRAGDSGVLDAPASGPGTSLDSGTC